MPAMDFNILVSFFPIISEKSAMDAVFANTNPYNPNSWLQDIDQRDPHHSYVVVDLFHQKRFSLAHGQHEFVVFRVKPRQHLGPGPRPRHDVKISRTIDPSTIPAKLGLWGPANDTIEVMHNEQVNPNEHVFRQSWTLAEAPSLRKASRIILDIHQTVPKHYLFSTPCYTFARATTDAVCLVANGANHPQPHTCLFKRSYFLRIIPAGTSKSKEVAETVARVLQNHQVDLSVVCKPFLIS